MKIYYMSNHRKHFVKYSDVVIIIYTICLSNTYDIIMVALKVNQVYYYSVAPILLTPCQSGPPLIPLLPLSPSSPVLCPWVPLLSQRLPPTAHRLLHCPFCIHGLLSTLATSSFSSPPPPSNPNSFTTSSLSSLPPPSDDISYIL